MISEQMGLKNCEFEAKDSVRQQLAFHIWSKYRMLDQFGSIHLFYICQSLLKNEA